MVFTALFQSPGTVHVVPLARKMMVLAIRRGLPAPPPNRRPETAVVSCPLGGALDTNPRQVDARWRPRRAGRRVECIRTPHIHPCGRQGRAAAVNRSAA